MLKFIDSCPFAFFNVVMNIICLPISFGLGLFDLGILVVLYNGLMIGIAAGGFAMLYLHWRN